MSKPPSRPTICLTGSASAWPCSIATAASGSATAATTTPRAKARAIGGRCPRAASTSDEDPEQAAYRELFEETSIRSVEFIRAAEGWLTYDLPPELVGVSWKGRYRGQKQKWFALRFTGEESEIDVLKPGGGKYKPEFSSWRWESARPPARTGRALQAQGL